MHGHVTKLEIARRQLATAIDLFFADRDFVSVYSLAANSWEIIDVLCRKAGIESFSIQVRENVPIGKDLKINYVNNPYRNFFKHADTDSEKTLPPLPDKQVEGVLFLAVEDYVRLNGRSPVQFQVFQLWYLAKYPAKLTHGVSDELMQEIAAAFPGLTSLPRNAQLAQGDQMLAKAARDQEPGGNPKTEPAFPQHANSS
jgi:hypothetical protein